VVAAAAKIAGERMNTKRLAKRHKRQVARAREKGKPSEPDVRTHEQIVAARLASRPDSVDAKNPWPSQRGAPAPAASSE
jgi:hypothetical protein